METRKPTPKDALSLERLTEVELRDARSAARDAERAATAAQKRYDIARQQSNEIILGKKET